MIKIPIKRLRPGAFIPARGSDKAAGFDLYVCDDNAFVPVCISPGQTIMFKTGIAMAIPDGYWGGIYPRSGLATKQGLRPANCVGVIDSDYRGEIIVALHNDSLYESKYVKNGDRIAQLIISSYACPDFDERDELDDTARGDGGFGHTGVR